MNFQDVLRDVHDPSTHALKTTASLSAATVYVGNPTLYAVVNTAAAGQASVVLDASPNFIGIVTIANPAGPYTIEDGGNVITIDGTVIANQGAANTDPWFISNRGNITLSNSNTYIGLVTATFARDDIVGAGNTGGLFISTASGTLQHVTLKVNNGQPIGARTDNSDGGAVTSTTANLAVSNRNTVFNGTSWDRMPGNVSAVFTYTNGTSKSLINLPVGLGQGSIATIAVPTNANKIKVTNFLLSSNVTTEVAIKSGVTYLTGNASLGVTLFPGGGFELPGSPDSPSWIGLPSGALVVEKRDAGGTVSKIAGHAIYFDEA